MNHRLETSSPQSVPALSVRGMSKSFGANLALDSVDLDVAPGEIHALIGENGSGKSTLIKILAGYHEPDPGGQATVAGTALESGSAESAYAAGCRLLHQELGLVESLSVLDNLFIGTGFPSRWGTIRRRAAARESLDTLELVGAGIDPRALVADLAPAQRTAVAVARTLRRDPAAPVKFMVFDEPTATLPDGEVQNLLELVGRVASGDIGVLYVTHRLDEIFGFADNLTVLRDGRKVASTPVAGLTRREVVNMLVGDEFDEARAGVEKLATQSHPVLLRATGIESETLSGVDLVARSHEIVGVAGITGSGRETLLRTLFGGLDRLGGRVDLDGVEIDAGRPDQAVAVGVAYMPPDRKALGGITEMSARENFLLADVLRYWKWPRMRRSRERAEADEWFDRFDVRPRGRAGDMLAAFSGGNQQKVLLAKWMRVGPRVILLDEPTQGVDVGAKTVIYQGLTEAAESGSAVVVSSADIDELAALCHRVVIMHEGRVTDELAAGSVSVPNIARGVLRRDEEKAG